MNWLAVIGVVAIVVYFILLEISLRRLQKQITELNLQIFEDESRLWKMERRVWELEEKLDSVVETIDILSDPQTVADIRQGASDAAIINDALDLEE